MGGEPERDESGLPPVDIEIPDDARELDRDIHAYHRELRAERRRRRVQRLIAPLTKHGMVVPLIAGLLAVTLFAGTMRSEEHTSELQSRGHLVCRLLLEK